MKRMLPFVAAAAIVAGCGSEAESTGAGGAAEGGKVAFVQGFTTDEYYVSQKCGFEEEARKRGLEPMVDGPANFDPVQQTPVLQAVVQKKPDAILLDPTDAKAMVAPIQQAKNAGIPLMTSGNSVDSQVPFTFISANQEEGGKLAAEKLMDTAARRREDRGRRCQAGRDGDRPASGRLRAGDRGRRASTSCCRRRSPPTTTRRRRRACWPRACGRTRTSRACSRSTSTRPRA